MFVHGSSLEGYYQTRNGLVFVQSEVTIESEHLFLKGLTFYPTTSAPLQLSVGEGLQIFRSVTEEARLQGFAFVTAEAFRIPRTRPGRMLTVTRNLR